MAFTGERTIVAGAGRTDTGVHALGQVAHVDLAKDWDGDTVRDAVNAHLRPHPVAVLTAERVAEDFDARFSAVKRHYLYRIVNRRPDLTLEQNRAWRVPRPLDDAAMNDAAQRLVGRHDFTTFRSAECQAKSPLKTLDRLDVTRYGDELRVARRRALIPATSGALDGRLACSCRRRQMERRPTSPPRSPPATARLAARSPRRTGFIWCGWITDAYRHGRARHGKPIEPTGLDSVGLNAKKAVIFRHYLVVYLDDGVRLH